MNPHKNPMTAFLLAFIPGLSQLYLNRVLKGLLFGAAFFGSIALFFFAMLAHKDEIAFVIFFAGVAIWCINMIDTVYGLLKRPAPGYGNGPLTNSPEARSYSAWNPADADRETDRFKLIVLSVLPGLGHFQLGLMQRGLGFLIPFFGVAVMIFFITAFTHRDVFLVFLGVLPILWLYSLFDCLQQHSRKERGEALIDRTVFDDFQENRESGRKSKTLATMLAMFPGAGHMYLGLQKRGLQLMAIFLFSIYVMDVMRLTLFLFLAPILWFYSFFDALQQLSKYDKGQLEDVPVVDWLVHHQRWVGIGLLALGAYFLFDQVFIHVLDKWFSQYEVVHWFNRYFQTFVISVLLIGSGIRLLFGSYGKRGE